MDKSAQFIWMGVVIAAILALFFRLLSYMSVSDIWLSLAIMVVLAMIPPVAGIYRSLKRIRQ